MQVQRRLLALGEQHLDERETLVRFGADVNRREATEKPKLTPFSYVILVLVGEGGAGAHDLIRMMRIGRIFWTAAPSHYYAEPKRLEKLGYLSAHKEPGKTRERTVYELTAKGRKAVREWLAEPSSFIRIQNEPAVRLLGADLAASPADVRRSLAAIREELEDLTAGLDEGERTAPSVPHRELYLRLNDRLGRRILAAFSDWLDEVERELS
jgi:DNA-binding PadR family transcriptional regulator